ncbi:AGAP000338-PA-like protein [Tupanvirus soda lake]|uniref:Phosphomevalonate kinase n=2 Tax=Tupanvirus TaxID=2094720 RepID=A0A6N1NWV3_9VIRU|nr:AGAP000338-PA-like protein [Tupanvirus soda lake]QKU34742.1 AGAP000338-PA-like protein [Tupanvirus soda lake]
MDNILCLIVLSGKRHVGKDHCGIIMSEILESFLHGITIKFVHVTTEIKREFAENKKIDFAKLQFDRDYKELYRVEMTNYSNSQMEKYGKTYYNTLFCQNILAKTIEPTVYIVDCRYEFEIEIYKELNIPLILVRINANNNTRERRGWKYDSCIDEHPSETNLDKYNEWHFMFQNDTDGDTNITEFTKNHLYRKMIQYMCSAIA